MALIVVRWRRVKDEFDRRLIEVDIAAIRASGSNLVDETRILIRLNRRDVIVDVVAVTQEDIGDAGRHHAQQVRYTQRIERLSCSEHKAGCWCAGKAIDDIE